MAACRDLYGFLLPPLTEDEQSARAATFQQAKRLAKTWTARYPSTEFQEYGSLNRPVSIKQLARKGIPFELRPTMWYWLSGAAAKQKGHAPEYYTSLCHSVHVTEDTLFSIESDVRSLHFSYKNHPVLTSYAGLEALRRLLLAAVQHNPDFGYSKAMCNVTAFLLVVMGLANEEKVFWTLLALYQDRLFPFCDGQVAFGSMVEQKVFDNLVVKKLPKIQQRLRKLECRLGSVTSVWFASAFCTSLPAETVARVWDCLLVEGPKVLHRVALALLRKFENSVVSCTHDLQLKKVLECRVARVYDVDCLWQLAFKGLGSMPTSLLVQLRKGAVDEAETDVREHQERFLSLICQMQ